MHHMAIELNLCARQTIQVLEQDSTIVHLLLIYTVLKDDINYKTSKLRFKVSSKLMEAEAQGLIL